MTIDEKALDIARICAKQANRHNDNAWWPEAEKIATEAAYTALCQHKANLLALLESPEVVEREVFVEQVFEALRSGKIRDIDTNWRMANKVLPRDFSPWRKQDQVEISACYRKVHLSDVLQAARDIINHYHSAAITSFIKGVQVQSSESAQKVGSSPASPTSYAEPPAPDTTDSKDKQP